MGKKKFEPASNGHKSALVYCRVSSKNQEEGTSLETQEQACIKHAESLGYSIGRVTKEVYSGAELFDRPLLSRDRADLRAGQFQALICYAIDRLSRDIAHLAIIADECERAGAELIFVTEQLDSSPEGKLLQSVRGYVAEVERQKIKERTMRGKLARLQSGKVHNFADDLYGYTRDKEKGIRVIKDDEADIIRRIFRLYVMEQMGIERIARRLNQDAVPSPKAGKRDYFGGRVPLWHGHAIHAILTRTEYKGEATAWKSTRPRVNGKTKLIRRDVADRVKLPPESTPAIVSAEIWQQAQERLKANSGAWTCNQVIPCLLRGLISCANCGHTMFVGNGGSSGRKCYRCFTTYRSVTGEKCVGGATWVESADQTVWALIEYIVQRPQIIIKALEHKSKQEPDARLAAELESVDRLMKKTEMGMSNLVNQLSVSRDPAVLGIIQQKIAESERRMAQLRKEADELSYRIAAQEANRGDARQLADYFKQVRKRLAEFDFSKKRMLIESLGVRVAFNGNGKSYKVTWRFDPKTATLTNYDQELAVYQARDIQGGALLDSTSILTT